MRATGLMSGTKWVSHLFFSIHTFKTEKQKHANVSNELRVIPAELLRSNLIVKEVRLEVMTWKN